jgi:DNA-directed RNA polymerase subunit RPC12/RpoP
MQITTTSPLLKAFENLGALTDNYGLYEIKPFKDWRGDPVWREKIFKIRLLNSGQVLEILKAGADVPTSASEYFKKFELLSRAIWSINDEPLATEEEVIEYNRKNGTELTLHQFIVNWMYNLEDTVLNRLDSVYIGLQVKQVRKLQNVYACENCGAVLKEVPKGTHELQYALSEVICNTCYPDIDKSAYDFIEKTEEAVPVVNTAEVITPESTPQYKCIGCGKEFDNNEMYRAHINECDAYSNSVQS